MPVSVPARSLIAVVGLLAASGVLGRLGVWQLERADETRTVEARFAAGAVAPPLTTPPAELGGEELRFRALELDGEYAADRQFLLDNMVHGGKAGYEVLTPLRLGGERWLLVNRGWVSAGGDRAVLPDVGVGADRRVVRGRLERLPRAGFALGAEVPPSAAAPVAVVEFPTAAQLAARLDRPLYDYQLLLDDGEPDGYVRDWRAPGIGPTRHLAYAGQWLLLAAGALAAAVGVAYRTWRARGGA